MQEIHFQEDFDKLDLIGDKPDTETFTCTVISPMFMFGANQKTPELREESFNGALHFWYRALWGHCKPITEIKLEEDKIFGSTQRAGKIQWGIRHGSLSVDKSFYKPHKHEETIGNRRIINNKDSILTGNTFTLSISKEFGNLFRLATLLGGFGGRSRRGFGCIEIEKFDRIEEVKSKIISLVSLENSTSILTSTVGTYGETILSFPTPSVNNNYPFIEKIIIRKAIFINLNDALVKINAPTSSLKSTYPNDYKTQMGDGKERFASPIIASLVRVGKEYLVILTKLKSVPPKPQYSTINLVDKYIETVMS